MTAQSLPYLLSLSLPNLTEGEHRDVSVYIGIMTSLNRETNRGTNRETKSGNRIGNREPRTENLPRPPNSVSAGAETTIG